MCVPPKHGVERQTTQTRQHARPAGTPASLFRRTRQTGLLWQAVAVGWVGSAPSGLRSGAYRERYAAHLPARRPTRRIAQKDVLHVEQPRHPDRGLCETLRQSAPLLAAFAVPSVQLHRRHRVLRRAAARDRARESSCGANARQSRGAEAAATTGARETHDGERIRPPQCCCQRHRPAGAQVPARCSHGLECRDFTAYVKIKKPTGPGMRGVRALKFRRSPTMLCRTRVDREGGVDPP